MAWTDGMSGAEHIFQWARNSQPFYLRMLRVRVPGNYGNDTDHASAALSLASASLREMRMGREVYAKSYDAADLLDAAKLFLAWDGEE